MFLNVVNSSRRCEVCSGSLCPSLVSSVLREPPKRLLPASCATLLPSFPSSQLVCHDCKITFHFPPAQTTGQCVLLVCINQLGKPQPPPGGCGRQRQVSVTMHFNQALWGQSASTQKADGWVRNPIFSRYRARDPQVIISKK